MRTVVTGGAGFIGSHLVDRLLEEGYEVKVIDNLVNTTEAYLEPHFGQEGFRFVKMDILEIDKLKQEFEGIDVVFHLAANADIRRGLEDTRRDLEQNTIATYNILEAMRVNDVKQIAFTSSAAVYGEPSVFPTPENVELVQTSFYGASKIAGEAIIEAFCEGFGMRSWIYRMASVVGERHSHGVTYDFYQKLKKDPSRLEILGDGTQQKSFLYVGDCVEGILLGYKRAEEKVNIFNLGTESIIRVRSIADTVIDELGLRDVEYSFGGGSRGWIGDAPIVLLSVDKIKALGWRPQLSNEEGIRRTLRWLRENEA